MIPLLVLFVLLTAGQETAAWDNDYEGVLLSQCGIGDAFSRVASQYTHTKRDRRWDFSCKHSFPVSMCPTCKWLALTDSPDIKCDDNHVMAGSFSQFDPKTKDRKWRFFCCSVSKLCTFDCYYTPYIGSWYESFEWFVPGANYLTGVRRSGFNGHDRRWSFRFCRLKPC